jgi:hypothetical protein
MYNESMGPQLKLVSSPPFDHPDSLFYYLKSIKLFSNLSDEEVVEYVYGPDSGVYSAENV